MTFQPGANLYTAGFGTRPENVEVPHIEARDPSTTDVNYPIGKRWLNTSMETEFNLYKFQSVNGVTEAIWASPVGATGAVISLNDGSITQVFPDSQGAISIVGTANQLTTQSVPGSNSISLELSDPLNPPGVFTANNGAVNLCTVGNDDITIGSPLGTTQSLTVNSPIQSLNSVKFNIVFVNPGVYNATGKETFFNCNTAGAITINLSDTYTYGTILYIADTLGIANVNNITINAGAGFKFTSPSFIDLATITISQSYGAYTIISTDSTLCVLSVAT